MTATADSFLPECFSLFSAAVLYRRDGETCLARLTRDHHGLTAIHVSERNTRKTRKKSHLSRRHIPQIHLVSTKNLSQAAAANISFTLNISSILHLCFFSDYCLVSCFF